MTVSLVYFAYLAVMTMASPAGTGRKRWALVMSLGAVAALLIGGAPHVTPLVYLLIGYWLPALLVRAPNTALEERLLRFDRLLFGSDGLAAFVRRAPRALLEYLEFAYLFCYPVVPIGFGCLVRGGFQDRAPLFWSTVLLAAFSCYDLLPWLASRTPRALEDRPIPVRSSVRKLNLLVLDRASVQWNTFPSGHTAASLASALVVGAYLPVAGLLLGFVAISIAIGSVVGRYHYAADAVAGALVAIAAFLMASAVHGR